MTTWYAALPSRKGTAAPPAVDSAVPPSVAIGLWNRHRNRPVFDQLLHYTNDLAAALRTGKVPELQRAPLSDLNLSTAAHNALRRSGIHYVDQVELLATWQLTEIKGVGETIAQEVVYAVRQHQRRQAAAPVDALQGGEALPLAAVPQEPFGSVEDQLENIDSAFYSWTEDNERQAALLMHAADLAAAHGPEHVRTLAGALLERRA